MERLMTASSHVSVPLATGHFLGLAKFLKENGSSADPVEIISVALDYWMENAAWKKGDLILGVNVDARGYSWKTVFLPTGTVLRIKYEGQFHYAKVEGDYLLYEGKQVSPNQFAFIVTRTARDAWRDLWVKRPSDDDYRVADDLRRSNK
jgi:hypothetical protein